MEVERRRIYKNLSQLSKMMVTAAKDLGCDYKIVSAPNIYWIIKGKKKWLFYGVHTPLNPLPGGKLADNKKLTKRVWKDAGIPVTQDFILKKDDYKMIIREKEIFFPVVLKPIEGTIKGHGVITNIKSKKELLKMAKRLMRKGYDRLLAEEYLEGLNDFRVLVLKGKVIAVTKRLPPYVIGDGKSTIKKLIEEKNEEREKVAEGILGSIAIDEELKEHLASYGMNLRSKPAYNKYIQLKGVCNLGSGGEGEDMTNEICEYNKNLAIKAADTLDMGLAGLDFLCKDITKPLKRKQGVLIEINEQPGFVLHHYPQKGRPRPVATKIIKQILKLK